MLACPSPLVRTVLGCAFEVHTALGPGLLESTYQRCLAEELALKGVPFKRELRVPLVYRGVTIESAYRIDFLIDGKVVLEIKSIDEFQPVHLSQMLTYLKLLDLKQGILLNFNVPMLKMGIRNVLR